MPSLTHSWRVKIIIHSLQHNTVHWQENNSKSAELFRMASNKCLLNVDMPTFSQLTSAADDNLKV